MPENDMSQLQEENKLLRERINALKQTIVLQRTDAERRIENMRQQALQLLILLQISMKMSKTTVLEEQLQYVAEGIVKARLYRRAIISLFDEKFTRRDVAYGGLTQEEIATHKHSRPLPREIWTRILSDAYRISNSYYIPHNASLNREISGVPSQRSPEDFKKGWHPEDFLFVPLKDSRGKTIGILSVDDPLDGRKPTEKSLKVLELFAQEAASILEKGLLYDELKKTENYLEQLIESSADIIVTTNAKGEIVLFNQAAVEILGYKPSEVRGKNVLRLYKDMEAAKRVTRVMRTGSGKVRNYEVEVISKSGEVIPISLSATILRDKNGNEIGTAGISRDLRPIKQLQEQILKMERQTVLKKAVVTLSHHIFNQLMGILSQQRNLTDSIRQKGLANKLADELEALDKIGESSRRIAAITKALSDPPKELKDEIYLGEEKMFAIETSQGIEATETPSTEKLSYNVLVADDEEAIRRGVADIFRRHGCNVIVAKDGNEAITLIDENKFDIVVSDIKMPGCDGYEVYRYAKQKDPKTGVILMTAFGYDPNHTIVKASRDGLKGVFFKEKPFDPQKLLSLVGKVVQK